MMIDSHLFDSYTYFDNVFSFEGSVSVEQRENSFIPWRIDIDKAELFPFIKNEVAAECSGVRLMFYTDSENIMLKLDNENEYMTDLYVDGRLFKEYTVEDEFIECTGLPKGLKLIEFYLDQRHETKLERVYISKNSQIRKAHIHQKRWIHYGSSISHSRAAARPSKTWTTIVSRKENLHLTNLGFDSECKCDPIIGKMISKLPADYITLKVGINLVDGDLNTRSFKPAVIGLIESIRETHKNTPLAICSPIYTPLYDDIRGGSNFNLKEMREVLEEIVDIYRKYDDRNIYYCDGLKLFGEKESNTNMPDRLHPDADGQYIMADHFIKNVFEKFPF